MVTNHSYFYGKKFSQTSLNYNFQLAVCGQSTIYRFIISAFTILLGILSGSILGVFSGLLGNSLVSIQKGKGDDIHFYAIFAVLVSIIWLFETSRYSFSNGLWKASIITIIIFFISLGISKNPDIIPYSFLLLTLLFVGLAVLIFLTTSLSFALFFSLFGNRHQYFKTMTIIMIIILSVIVAYFFDKPPSIIGISMLSNVAVVKILAGMILGFAFVKASYKVTNFSHKANPNFLFLKNWAINLTTWGSTSFYNLDLSRIDFTHAIVANTDFRGNKFYRTCLRNVKGLDRARVDNRYIDLDNPKVQKLLVDGRSDYTDFSSLNLQGAYLRDDAILRGFDFTNTNLSGADLSGADLRDAILVRAQCIDVDFTDANLTGICIQDWSVNNQTCFNKVRCDYIYRKLNDQGKPCDRYPLDRNFEPREFEYLYQEVGNVVELVFEEGINWRAFAFTLQQLQIEDDGLGLKLQGIEKRGDLWVVKVIHNENVTNHEVEKCLNASYEQLQQLLASKEQQINQLLGIAGNQAEVIKIKEVNERSSDEKQKDEPIRPQKPENSITIMCLASDPTDAARLRLGQELHDIQERLQQAKHRERFVLQQQLSVRPGDISQALLESEPTIVHFSGHGTSNGELCFENESGKIQPVKPEALAALFKLVSKQVKCVVLNACFSEVQAKAIAQHIQYVVGMNQAIGDKAAIAFSVGFYTAIGANRSIREAYQFGCTQIQLEDIPEHLVPVLFEKD